MKGHTKRKLQGMLAMLLAVAMVVTCVPGTAFTAYAATGQEDIQEPGVDQPAATDDGSSETSGGGYEDDAIEEPAEDGGDEQQPSDGEEEDGMPEEETDGAEEDADEQEEEELAAYADVSIMSLGASNENLPPAVLFGFDYRYEDLGLAEATDEYNPWMHNGTHRDGSMFINRYYYDEQNPNRGIDIYFGIQTEMIPADSTPKLALINGNSWITEFSEPEFQKKVNYKEDRDNGQEETAEYSYYKVTMEVSGRNGGAEPVKLVTVKDNVETDVTTFYIKEYSFTPKYRVKKEGSSAYGDWQTVGNGRPTLSVGDTVQVDFVSNYRLDGNSAGTDDILIGQVNVDTDLVSVADLPDEPAAIKTQFNTFDRQDEGGTYIFTYSNRSATYYPELEIKGAGVIPVGISVFDEAEEGIFGDGFEFTSLPDYQLKQDLTKEGGTFTLGEALLQSNDDDQNENTNVNPLGLPSGNHFKFYICDENGTPLQKESDVTYAVNGERYLSYQIGWNDDWRQMDWDYGRFTIGDDEHGIYLDINAENINFPFPAALWFSMWMDLEIVKENTMNGTRELYVFRYQFEHEAEGGEMIVFGAGDYLDDQQDESENQWRLEDRANDAKADYDNTLFINMGFVDEQNMTVPVYVRIPADQSGTDSVSAMIGADNAWIRGNANAALSVTHLWEYTIQEYDDNGQVIGEIGTYNYYKIDLPLLTNEEYEEAYQNVSDKPDKVGVFTVKNGENDPQTFKLYEVWLQYQIKKSAGDWEDKEHCDFRTIELEPGDSIRFVIDGWGTFANPFGAVRITENGGEPLVGYEQEGNGWRAIDNQSVFVTPELTANSREQKKLEGTDEGELWSKYGAWGQYQAFYYPAENQGEDDLRFNPEFTVADNAKGTNRMDVSLWNQYGQNVCNANVMVSVGRSNYAFKQEGKKAEDPYLTNWQDEEEGPDWGNWEESIDKLLPVKADAEDGNKLKLKFYLYNADGSNVVPDAGTAYALAGGSNFNFRWRQMEYWGEYSEESQDNVINIKQDNDNKVYLEIDLSRMEEEVNPPSEQGAFFNPSEQYDLDLNFVLRQLDTVKDSELFNWSYSYAMRHPGEISDVIMFGLGDWDNFDYIQGDSRWNDWLNNNSATFGENGLDEAYLASAWQYRLENKNGDLGCNMATYSNAIVGSAGTFNQMELPVYVRIPDSKAPAKAEDVIEIGEFHWKNEETGESGVDKCNERLAAAVTDLGICASGDVTYHYYRIILSNADEQSGEYTRPIDIDAYSQIPLEVKLNDNTSETFTIKGMVVQYQIAKEGRAYGQWIDYLGGGHITVEAGDKIRFNVDGSICPGEMRGEINEVSTAMFDLAPLHEKAEAYLNERYEWIEYGRAEGGVYRDCRIFHYDDKADNWPISYPELTVKEYTGMNRIAVSANDAYGEGANCGEDITFSTLPKFTLVQGNSKGALTGGPLILDQDAPDMEYRNPIVVPADGIFRFYLCDENGEKIDLSREDYMGLAFADMDPSVPQQDETLRGSYVNIYPYQWDGNEVGLHYTWKNETVDSKKNCYLEIDLSGNEKTDYNNNWICNDDEEFWLGNGFDLWLHAELFATDETGKEGEWNWMFNYGFMSEFNLRQQGNEGEVFREEYSEWYDRGDAYRYNLNPEGDNTILPSEDGKLRFYYYDLKWNDDKKYRETAPATGMNPLESMPEVTLYYDRLAENKEAVKIPLTEKHVKVTQSLLADQKWYLEIDLSDLTVEGDKKLDIYSDSYRLNIRYTKQVYDDQGKAETRTAREYRLSYRPVTVMAWNSVENLAEELAGDMTGDSLGRLAPYALGYADASTVYKPDGSVALYVRIPKELKPTGTDFVGLAPSEKNLWVGTDAGKKENWFTQILSVQELDLKTMYNSGADWSTYPVDADQYVYYRVHLKGGERNTMDRGAITVTLNDVIYDFTLEQATAQYSSDGTDWTDIQNDKNAREVSTTVVALGENESRKLRLKASSLSDTGVIAMVQDYEQENPAFRLHADDLPEVAEDYWNAHYAEDFGGRYRGVFYDSKDKTNTVDLSGVELTPGDWDDNGCQKFTYTESNETKTVWYEEGCIDWGMAYIFTYEEGNQKYTYYPNISSSESATGNKYLSFFVIQEDGEHDWVCQVQFDKAKYSFRYEKDLDHDMAASTVPFDLSGDTMKFYVYKDDALLTVAANTEYGFSDREWNQLACFLPNAEAVWDEPWDGTGNSKFGVDDKGLYLELATAPLKRLESELGYEIKDRSYMMKLRVPIWLGDEDSWFLIYDVQNYFGPVGAKLILGEKTTTDGEDNYEITEAVSKGGTVEMPLSQGTFLLDTLNVDCNRIDISALENGAITVTSSNPDAVEVLSSIVYAGENKWNEYVFKPAKLAVKAEGDAEITYKYTPVGGSEQTVSFKVNVVDDKAVALEDALKAGTLIVETKPDSIVKRKYTGEPIRFDTVKLTVREDGQADKELVLNKDYTLLYEDNIEVGTAKLTISAMRGSGFAGTIVKTFRIVNAYAVTFDLDGGYFDDASNPDQQDVLDGDHAKAPTKEPKKDGYTFAGWFTNSYFNTEFDFEGTEITGDTVICAKWLQKGVFTVEEIEPLVYTGKALKPVVKVYDGDKLLTEKVDYTVKYNANTAANWITGYDKYGDPEWATPNVIQTNGKIKKYMIPTVTITGKGNYNATKDITFEIRQRDITEKEFTVATLPWVVEPANNKPVEPVPVIKYSGKALKKGTAEKPADFQVTYPDKQEGAYKVPGVYNVIVEGTGNYKGRYDLQFGIVNKTTTTLASKLKVTVPKSKPYTGEAITLTPDDEIKVSDGKTPLVYGKHYELEYRDNVEIGKATVLIIGKSRNGYAGVKEMTFTITGAQISKTKLVDKSGALLKKIPDNKNYNGTSQTWSEMEVGLMDGTYRLVKDEDYTVSYTKNKDAGTATMLFTGINAYSGTLKKTFKIKKYNISEPDQTKFDVTVVSPCAYQKGGSTPAVTVTFDGKALTAGKDYTVSYSNNKGIADESAQKPPTVTITGKGNFDKKLSKTFSIKAQAINDSSILVIVPHVKFAAGKGKFVSKPVVYDTTNGKKLDLNKDYTVDYYFKEASGMILDQKTYVVTAEDKAKTVVAVIKGKAPLYDDSETTKVEVEYQMVDDVFNPKVLTIADQVYTGEAIKIDPAQDPCPITAKLTKDGPDLKYGVDYEIVEGSYTNNTAMGKNKASVIIRGLKTAGTKTVKFTIAPKPIIVDTTP